jgi:hypothetical protein
MASGSPGDPTPPDIAVCYGVCRPAGQVCSSGTESPILPSCDGTWSVSYDAAGCPYPVCVCADGTTSLDGICRDLCANVDCVGLAEPTCDAGFLPAYVYPYCCGACVPINACDYYASGGGSGSTNGAPTYACPEVACAYGYEQAIDPTNCCPTCVPSTPGGCLSTGDCPAGQYCSTETGACNPPPGCEPDNGTSCLSVCYGECLESFDQTRSDCTDSDGGIVPESVGLVIQTEGGTVRDVVDTCSADGTAVLEYYCYVGPEGRFVRETFVLCATAAGGAGYCYAGACVP